VVTASRHLQVCTGAGLRGARGDRATLQRSTIFWQTRTIGMKANPGERVPQRRVLAAVHHHADTREKYAFRFARRHFAIEQVTVEAGDCGVRNGDRWLAEVERKAWTT
jgi:hypothetical protein